MQSVNDLLKDFKNKKFAPLYLFYGEEDYLKNLALKSLKTNLLGEENQEFNCVILNKEEISPQEIIEKAYASPFFGEKRLLIIEKTTLFSNTKNQDPDPKDHLLSYLNSPNPSTCLVFEAKAPVNKQKRLYKALIKNGLAFEFNSPNLNQLKKWIQQQVQKKHKKIDPKAIELLLNRTNFNLNLLNNELEKIFSYTLTNDFISKEVVEKLTPIPLEENIFKVVDFISDGKITLALKGIEDLLKSKESPQLILAMISRQFRLFLQIKEALDNNFSEKEITSSLGIASFVVKKLTPKANSLEKEEVIKNLIYLQEIDFKIKTGQKDFVRAMEEFVVNLAINLSPQNRPHPPKL